MTRHLRATGATMTPHLRITDATMRVTYAPKHCFAIYGSKSGATKSPLQPSR
jgi:hypothetical protein